MGRDLEFVDTNLRMPLMSLPVRTVIASVGDKKIMFSPGSQIHKDQYLNFGPISDLVAPNLFHLGGVPKGAEVYPEAKLWAPRGGAKKRKDIPWTDLLSLENWPYSSVLEPHLIEGMPGVNEVVFIHHPSRSLIVADLIFNLAHLSGMGAWLIMRAFGTYSKAAVSRLFLAAVKDSELFKDSMKKLLNKEFERIIPCHGEILEGDVKKTLVQALSEKGYGLS